MLSQSKWLQTKEEQENLINALTNELPPLRAKVGISQGELATLIGVSRQTYSAIESGKRVMSWGTYLSLIFFFDYNFASHQMIRQMGAFPDLLVERFNSDNVMVSGSDDAIKQKYAESAKMLDELDDQGRHAVSIVLKMEHDRCASKKN